MDEMIERVAQSLWSGGAVGRLRADWHMLTHITQQMHRNDARHAIAAMREISAELSVADFYFFMGRAAP